MVIQDPLRFLYYQMRKSNQLLLGLMLCCAELTWFGRFTGRVRVDAHFRKWLAFIGNIFPSESSHIQSAGKSFKTNVVSSFYSLNFVQLKQIYFHSAAQMLPATQSDCLENFLSLLLQNSSNKNGTSFFFFVRQELWIVFFCSCPHLRPHLPNFPSLFIYFLQCVFWAHWGPVCPAAPARRAAWWSAGERRRAGNCESPPSAHRKGCGTWTTTQDSIW